MKIRCSEWCGFGCTQAAFDQATKEASEMVARLGPGWTARVWENGGWHYSAVKGVAEVHANICGSALMGGWTVRNYTTYLNSQKQVIADAATPEDSLGFTVQDMRTLLRCIEDDLAVLNSDEVPA